ncbi:MAG TPA: feruloyl-CoA synthase [Vicinamibacterales bacterium]|nr:feruloyl-CoA synthase [Vicinamibacterales bacterium]
MKVRAVALGPLPATLTRRADGTMLVRTEAPLREYPRRSTDRLVYWAGKTPNQTLLAWRGPSGEWERLTYGDAFAAVRRVGQALVERTLSADRPVAILSGNDREHLLLSLAAQHVGLTVAPISPAYSTLSKDFAMLRHAMRLLTPGLVFASRGAAYDESIRAAVPADVEVIRSLDALLATPPTDAVDRAHDAIAPDTIAKILLTSGSTAVPKGVINTHRMLGSNQEMIAHILPFMREEPPVLVDWLPWHHTFGGNHNIGLVIHHGGTLYIDDGRPVPGLFGPSVRNLRETPTNVYLNVPRGYEELVKAMRDDEVLRKTFFSRMRVLFYAAAALAQHVKDELDELAYRTIGERLILVTGLGATETAPMAICRTWDSDLSIAIGVPVPGVEAKLVPHGDKLEVRVKGPNVTPGYWRQDDLTRRAFDEEGFYSFGDCVRFIDPDDINAGFAFDGRLAEDFKLSTGTWVNVGPLRAQVIAHFAPLVRDAVITGEGRDELGMLAVPDVDACRALCQDLSPAAGVADVLRHPAVLSWIAGRLASFAASAAGSSKHVARAMLLEEPPSLDALEATDKGSINQRATLKRRAPLVDELYAGSPRVVTATERPRPRRAEDMESEARRQRSFAPGVRPRRKENS